MNVPFSLITAALMLPSLAGAWGTFFISPEGLAKLNPEQRERTIVQMRNNGMQSFAHFMHVQKDLIAKAQAKSNVPMYRDYLAFIDRVAQQYDAASSGLFWHTSEKEARNEASAWDRPVIYLRLLGKLSEEYSCANSRFFRSALYADPTVAAELRKNFMLCWESERDIPVMTIAFGDGRTIKQTITGNSAHYAVTPDGQVLDVLPGLYTPEQFKAWLGRMTELYRATRQQPKQADALVAQYHKDRCVALSDEWGEILGYMQERGSFERTIALAKPSAYQVKDLDAFWRQAVHHTPSKTGLSPATVLKIKGENRPKAPGQVNAELVGRLAATKAFVETPVMRRLRMFQDNIAVDGLRNEHLMHAQLHSLLAQSKAYRSDLSALNRYVYDNVFMTPANDPWLGLLPADRYYGLRSGGATLPVAKVQD